jgi:hypothetical protein
MGLLSLLGKAVKEIVAMGYPESVAKRISSGDLPMDEASRMARAKEQGYDFEYHGTNSDFMEVDPDAVDLGLHTGSMEQANNRLQDISGHSKYSGLFAQGAQVMPLAIKRGNEMSEMRDIGRWHDAVNVAPELDNIGYDTYDLYDDLSVEKKFYETPEDWVKSPENREGLDELRGLLTDDGYDTIRYENLVENDNGNLSGLRRDVLPYVDDIYRQKSEIMNAAASRMPERMPMPKPTDPDAEQAVMNWLKQEEDLDPKLFLTDAEKKILSDLEEDRLALVNNPFNYNDTRSTINMRPENIRSAMSAAFDPEYTGSNILGSRVAPTVGAVLLSGLDGNELSDYDKAKYMNQQMQIDNMMGNKNEDVYNYGDVLPIKRNKVTGDYSLANTGIVEDIMRGLLDVGLSRKSGMAKPTSILEMF